jgi:dihydroneopterin aldolase
MTVLRIRDLVLFVHLGVTPQERSGLQEVRLDIDLAFEQPPLACETDRIEDTLCYGTVCDTLRLSVVDRQFALIEHLSQSLIQTLRPLLQPHQRFRLAVHKLFPPVENLRGGVIFEQGEI